MIRRLQFLLAALLLTCTCGVAHAQSAPWVVSEVSGKVTLREGSKAETASRGSVVAAGEIVETAAGARAVIVRGKDFVTVAPNSRIRIPDAETARTTLFDVIEEWGNALFQIEKKPQPHFSVGTPYLAAVVKGTTWVKASGTVTVPARTVAVLVEKQTASHHHWFDWPWS